MTAALHTPVDLDPVFAFVAKQTGLVFGAAQAAAAADRVRAGMHKAELADPVVYVERLSTDGLLLDDLVAGLTVGETYFFRDPAMYRYLKEQFLPRLERLRPKDHILRVWSAGCATGEEAYSAAMLLEGTAWSGRFAVMGTDISRAALVKARKATYGEWSFRAGDRSFMKQYFTSMGSTFVLIPRVRDHAHFQYHNLALDGCPSLAAGMFGLDLILCRNVLMYLDPAVIGKVAGQFRDALLVGGIVVTGLADPPLHRHAALSSELFDEGTVYWRHTMAPAHLIVTSTDAGHFSMRVTSAAGDPPAMEADDDPPTARVQDEAREDAASFASRVRVLAEESGPAVAVVEAQRGMALFPLSVDIAFLLAILPAAIGSYAQAAEAARRALYLDRFQPALHFVLGTSLWNCGDLAGARRGFRNARDLAAARPDMEPVLFAEGETAGRVAAGAAAHLAMVDSEEGVRA